MRSIFKAVGISIGGIAAAAALTAGIAYGMIVGVITDPAAENADV